MTHRGSHTNLDASVSIRDGWESLGVMGRSGRTDTSFIYASVELDEWTLNLCVESKIPRDHGLHQARSIDYDAWIDCPSIPEWMMEHGIAPGQLFLMGWSVYYSSVHTPDGSEYEDEALVRVLWVEPWPAERIADAWQEWIDAGEDVIR